MAITKPNPNGNRPTGSSPTRKKERLSIFDPYDKDNYNGDFSVDKMFNVIDQPDAIISSRRMNSVGCFVESGDGECIYIHKIQGNCAVLQIGVKQSYKSHGREHYIAVGFYDKSLKNHLDVWERNKEKAIKEEYKTSDLLWHFGIIKRKDIMSKKDWIVIPREIFSNINDEVYLCICTEAGQGKPIVKCAEFPNSAPFFYDRPVATSIYRGQSLKGSKIILGTVMKYENEAYLTMKGKYRWDSLYKPMIKGGPAVDVLKISDYCFHYDNSDYICPEIELYVYAKSPKEKENEISAFVWQSGNDDDDVKKSYIQEGNESPYNTYPNILDCLSSHTMYGSMVSLTKFTADNAAKYVARALAKQPAGSRCISIDGNNLVNLMGGALFQIERVITQVIVEAKAQEALAKREGRKLTEEEKRKLTDDEFNTIEDLFAINNNHLFFDTAITYNNNPQERARHYMQDVLGIEENSNGCKKIQKLLTDLFAQIAKLGIGVDYVYCDIEGLWNNANSLRIRRFNERYFQKLKTNQVENSSGSEFYTNIVLPELKSREMLWNDMLHRGFSTPDSLKDISSVRDDETRINGLYGLGPSNYASRRDVNIWDAVMRGYLNDLYYKYIMSPVLKSHPKAKCSVFCQAQARGYINHAKRFETYLGGDVKQHPDMYSNNALYGGVSGEYYKKLCMDNWKMYPNLRNFFSYFVGCINVLRSTLVSSQSEKLKNGRFNAFISSFNIWVNGYGLNEADDDTMLDEGTDQNAQQSTMNDKFIQILEAYYNEFIYHVFLCNPDKVNSYFHVETKMIKNHGIYGNGGKYYFPFGNGEDFESHRKYFTDCYSRLQKAIDELNLLFKGQARETTVNTLATETEPYVISGVKLKDKTLWRVTLNEPITEGSIKITGKVIVISLSNGKKISFVAQKKPDIARAIGKYGLWIETSLNYEPTFSAEDYYYENNPAYIFNLANLNVASLLKFGGLKDLYNYIRINHRLDEFAIARDRLYFIREHANTIFGESPQFFTFSMRFKLNHEMSGYTQLLSATSHPMEFVIGEKNHKASCMSVSSWKKTGKDSNNDTLSKVGNENLIPGKSYEVIKYIAFHRDGKPGNVDCYIRQEFWKLAADGLSKEKMILADETEYSYTENTPPRYYFSEISLLSNLTTFGLDAITLGDFKVYFTQQHEKLELFRESDGVNIGRVNKRVEAYVNLPVETKQSDTLIGKLSWLNATNQPARYDISFFTFDGNRKLQSFENIVSITVEPNSEGNKLIKLPPLMGATRVTLESKKPGSLDNSAQQIALFNNYFNENSHKVISVDIVP
jgi:hypothetical protein